jgi:hypothetical protein
MRSELTRTLHGARWPGALYGLVMSRLGLGCVKTRAGREIEQVSVPGMGRALNFPALVDSFSPGA